MIVPKTSEIDKTRKLNVTHDRSAFNVLSFTLFVFVEAVFKSAYGFSCGLFVTVVTLYHVDNVFVVTVNVAD